MVPAFSWSALPDLAKWLLSFMMLIGRLELFGILAVCSRLVFGIKTLTFLLGIEKSCIEKFNTDYCIR